MTQAKLFLLSAFASNAHGGNPAAVIILPSDIILTDAKMQAIAKDLVQPMQAFVTLPHAGGDSDYGIRWFNAENEFPICMHATLAAAKAVWLSPGSFDDNTEVLRFRTAFGAVVSAQREKESGRIEITFPHAPTVQIPNESPEGVHIRSMLTRAFGTKENGETLEIKYMGHGTGQYKKYLLVDMAEDGGFKLEGRKVVTDALVSHRTCDLNMADDCDT